FVLHPSAQIVVSRYPVLRIWQVNQPDYTGDDRVDLAEGDEALLVWRAADGIPIERLAPGEHAFLAALARNDRLSVAAEGAAGREVSFDPADVLQRLAA